MKYIVTLDGGLSKTRAVLFDLRGQEIDKVVVDNEIISVGDYREIDMNVFWENAAAAVAMLVEHSGAYGSDIVGIGLTGASEGLWPVGEGGEPVGNAVLNTDGRAGVDAEYVTKKNPGMGRLIHRNLGLYPNSGSPLMILRWTKRHCLEIYRQIQAILMEKDWLRYKMTGRIVTDFSDGNAGLLHFPNGRIPNQMLTVLELHDAISKLPGVLDGCTTAGELTEQAARQMHLLPGTPVAVGGGEIASGMFGIGAVQEGDFGILLGDAPAVGRILNRRQCDPSRSSRNYLSHLTDDLAIELVSTLDIQRNVAWALDELTGGFDLDLADQLVAKSEPGAGGVIFLPYLLSQAERIKSVESQACGCFFGMTGETTKAQMIRAVYESIGYAVWDAVGDRDQIDHIFFGGEAEQDSLLPRIIANVLDATVSVAGGSEFPSRGAAMACCLATGVYTTPEDAAQQCARLRQVFQPHTKSVYVDGFRRYRELRSALAPVWKNK